MQLEASEPHLHRAVREWLDRLQLHPAVPITIKIDVGEVQPGPDPRPPFRQPAVDITAGPPHNDLRVLWRIAPAIAVMGAGAHEVHVRISLEAQSRLDDCIRTFLTTVLILAVRRVGWHHVHAATALDPHGRGWLIAGNARAGKSTTAALLASRGWSVGTDDTVFARHDNDRAVVTAARMPIALRRGGQILLGQHNGVFIKRRRKIVVWPEDLGGAWVQTITPSVILFTEVGSGRVTTSTPMRSSEALAQLVRWSAWIVLEPDLAQDHLRLLNKLAAQAASYHVSLGTDLYDDPHVLTNLIP